MRGLMEYTDSRLKYLVGSFKIYKNKNNKFLHISEKSNIYVDCNFWKYVKTINKQN